MPRSRGRTSGQSAPFFWVPLTLCLVARVAAEARTGQYMGWTGSPGQDWAVQGLDRVSGELHPG